MNNRKEINIYHFYNIKTNDIFYVGQTSDNNMDHYLKSKYWKLNEVFRGGRRWNKLFRYLSMHKIEDIGYKIIDIAKSKNEGNLLEKYYIKLYRDKGIKILNETDGGFGGNTIKYKSDNQKAEIGFKIKNKLTNKPKPESQRIKLREIRLGSNNPSARKYKSIKVYKNNILIGDYNYTFELFCEFSKIMSNNIIRYCKSHNGVYIGRKKKFEMYKVILEE